VLHPDGEAWLCRRAEEVALSRAGRVVWHASLRSDGLAFVRGGERVALLLPTREVVYLGAADGRELARSEPQRCGVTLGAGTGAGPAFLHGRQCFVLLDGERTLWAMNGTTIQAAAVGDDARWALVTTEGEVIVGALDRAAPPRRTPGDSLFGVERRASSELGARVADISAMALLDGALLVGTLRGELVRLDLEGRLVARQRLAAGVPITALAPSPSGRVLGVSFDRGGPMLVETQRLQPLGRLPERDAGAMVLVDDARASTVAGRFARWALGPRVVRHLMGLGGITSLATDGVSLAVAHDTQVTRMSLERPDDVRSVLRAAPVKSVAVRGAELVLSPLDATSIEYLDTATLTPTPSPPAMVVRRLAHTANGTLVALPYNQVLWLVPPGDRDAFVPYGTEELIDLAVQGDRVALLARALDAVLLDVAAAPRELARCPAPGAVALSLAPDSQSFFVAHHGGVEVVAVDDCAPEAWFDARTAGAPLRLVDVQVSTDGRFVAAGSREGIVLVWQRDGTLIASPRTHVHRVAQLAFDPGSRWLWSSGWDGAVRSFELAALVTPRDTLIADVLARWGEEGDAPSD